MKKNFGITLLEVMLSLVVIAVIVALSIRYFGVSENQAKVSTAATNVKTLVQASQDWLSEQKAADFTNITNAALLNAGLVTNADLTNPWNSTIPICVQPGGAAQVSGASSMHVAIYILISDPGSCNLLSGELSNAILSTDGNTQCAIAGGTGAPSWPNTCSPLGKTTGYIFYGEF